MATATKWSNVAVALESAAASPVTVTAIFKGSTCTVTATNTYTNGDYVRLSVVGMYQLNEKIVRVASASGTNFVAEGVDSTLFETFVSGTSSKLTMGTAITTIVGGGGSGGDFDMIDTTTIHGNSKSQIPGTGNPMSYNFDHLWDPSDVGQIALKVASDAASQKAIRFTFGTGGKIVIFSGYVGFTGIPLGQAQDKVTTPMVITASGSLTQYAS